MADLMPTLEDLKATARTHLIGYENIGLGLAHFIWFLDDQTECGDGESIKDRYETWKDIPGEHEILGSMRFFGRTACFVSRERGLTS